MTTREYLEREQRRKEQKSEEPERRRLRRVLRLPEVEIVTGRKRSSIYEGIADGTFPAPIPLGAKSVGWIEDEIIDWQEQRIEERGKCTRGVLAEEASPRRPPLSQGNRGTSDRGGR